MKYYAVIGGQQAGPFEETELKNHGINADTLVWAEGMSDWQPAKAVAALAPLFAKPTPPPVPPVTPSVVPPVVPPVQPIVVNPVQPVQPAVEQQGTPQRKVNGIAIWAPLTSMTLVIFNAICFGAVASYTSSVQWSRSHLYDYDYYGNYSPTFHYVSESSCIPAGGIFLCVLLGLAALFFGYIGMKKGRGVKILRVIAVIVAGLAMIFPIYCLLVKFAHAHF